MNQREPRRESPAHLAFIRQQPCCVCGTTVNVQAAHIRMPKVGDKRPTGMGEKSHDRWTVPLCGWDHTDGPKAQHKMSERAFWQMHGIDPFKLAYELWLKSGAKEVVPREKKIKQRKPREQRKKIQNRNSFQRAAHL